MATYQMRGNLTGFRDTGTNVTVTPASRMGNSFYLPSTRTTKIMPLGDSITYGIGGEANGGYRGHLFNMLWQNGFKFSMVGPSSQPPVQTYTDAWAYNGVGHWGNSGWTLADMANMSNLNDGTTFPKTLNSTGKSAQDHVTTYQPDIVLLHAGTNGMSGAGSISTTESLNRLGTLVDQIFAGNPNVVLFLAQIISFSDHLDGNAQVYNANMKATVADPRIATGKKIVMVNQQDTITNKGMTYYYDGIHPNSVGYKEMAKAWFDRLAYSTGLGWS